MNCKCIAILIESCLFIMILFAIMFTVFFLILPIYHGDNWIEIKTDIKYNWKHLFGYSIVIGIVYQIIYNVLKTNP